MNTLNALTEYGLYKIQLKPDHRHRFILISSEASHIPHHAPAHITHRAPAHTAHHAHAHITHRAPAHTAHHAPAHIAHHAPAHTAHHAPAHTAHNTTNGQHTIHSTHHNTHDTKTSHHIISNGHNITKNSHQTTQDGHHTVNKTHKSVHPDGTHTTHNEKHTMQTENNANVNIQYQDQIKEPSEISSNEYKLDPQPKWGGPQKQSANVPEGQWRLNSAVTFLTVGFIKTRKRFSGKESSTALFEMFCWCADNKDKAFFRRLFDYTDWKILNINKIGIYDMVETSIVSSVVVEKFAYAMNLLLETSKYTRLSTESIKRLEKMKASLSTLG